MKQVKIKTVKAYIIDRLSKELPDYLTYHSVEHTLDVYGVCEKIALSENVSETDLTLLLTAALFHDAGFMISSNNHEEISCNIAEQVLPDFGYDRQDLQRISGMIRATKIPQDPHNLLEEIICDADLDYLGRDDYESIASQLYHELKYTDVLNTTEEWGKLQIRFLEQHHYFTHTAIHTRKLKKQQHLSDVKLKCNII